jgi:hypothetical protein
MGNPSIQKRQKERNRQDKQRDKLAKRQEKKNLPVGDRGGLPPGVDPDIAHIVPGPQPLPETDEGDLKIEGT